MAKLVHEQFLSLGTLIPRFQTRCLASFLLTIGIFFHRLIFELSINREIDVVTRRVREPRPLRRAGFGSGTRLARLELFYAADRVLHIIGLNAEMVQAVGILLVGVLQDS